MIKAEEAINVIKNNYPSERYSMLREALDLSLDLLELHLTPTFDKVVMAWGKVCDYNVVYEDGFVIVGDYPLWGYTFASISIDKATFDLPDYYNLNLHEAIDLTIRYLKGKKEQENEYQTSN